jgi:hypothetical protein
MKTKRSRKRRIQIEEFPEIVERFIRLEKNFEEERRFWRERLAYLSIIVGLITALILIVARG